MARRLVQVSNASTCASGTFVASGLPIAIPDDDTNGVSSAIIIRGSGTITSLQISAKISHTWIGDLRVTLVGPDGTQVVLHDQTGSSNDNIVRDAVAQPAFSGKLVGGTWALKVQDLAQADVGAINSWSLELTTDCGG